MQEIDLDQYKYPLPKEKIAQFPLKDRDQSKLLIFKRNAIFHQKFCDITDHISNDHFLFFNDTRVIQARLTFQKISGARIEIFPVNPIAPSTNIEEVMVSRNGCYWKCMIGNLKKWKSGLLSAERIIDHQKVIISVNLEDREQQIVRFSWNYDFTFSQIISHLGAVPLPPYVNRKAEAIDQERYQTIFSRREGAVAAPTASLHFTEEIFRQLAQKKIGYDYLTLHVSAGTFQPVNEAKVTNHPMHAEQFVVTRRNLMHMKSAKKILAVGTTSMRTLESTYWWGVSLLETGNTGKVQKLSPYQHDPAGLPSLAKVADAIDSYLAENQLEELVAETELFILPGYRFKVCQGLITNFHMPGSTLLLLVSAFIGESWKKIYQEALENDYRFLSYGDTSLLLR